jgi:hypothetical protein
MLEGIKVLSKVENVSDLKVFFILNIIFLCLSVIFVVMTIVEAGKGRDKLAIIGIILFIFFMILFMISICLDDNIKKPNGTYTYKVIVDENVSMVDFNENYEILEQDGLIYTIIERDDKNE